MVAYLISTARQNFPLINNMYATGQNWIKVNILNLGLFMNNKG